LHVPDHLRRPRIWDPVELVDKFSNPYVVAITMLTVVAGAPRSAPRQRVYSTAHLG